MEVEDPLSAKFRALIEGLMVSTTSEIVKIFSKVLLETRVEITRSWREIDLLKKHLEECEQQKTEAIFRAQRSDFKREDDEMEVSCGNSQLGVQSANTVRPGDVVSGHVLCCHCFHLLLVQYSLYLFKQWLPKRNRRILFLCLKSVQFWLNQCFQFVFMAYLSFFWQPTDTVFICLFVCKLFCTIIYALLIMKISIFFLSQGPEGRAENVSVGNRGVSLGNAKASGPGTARSSKPGTNF